MSSPSAVPLPNAYPGSFEYALGNRFTKAQLGPLLSSAKPLFVYGRLMLPPMVQQAIYDDMDAMAIAENMTPATLTKYERLAIVGQTCPAIVPSTSSEHFVEGFVVFGLTAEQHDHILHADHEARSLFYTLESVHVEIHLLTGETETIDADTYVWAMAESELYTSETPWSLENYLKDYYPFRL